MNGQDTLPEPGSKECQRAMFEKLMVLEHIMAELKDLKTEVASVKEILTAWNAVKGLGVALSWLASSIKVIGIIAAGIAAVWYFLKTGYIPPRDP